MNHNDPVLIKENNLKSYNIGFMIIILLISVVTSGCLFPSENFIQNSKDSQRIKPIVEDDPFISISGAIANFSIDDRFSNFNSQDRPVQFLRIFGKGLNQNGLSKEWFVEVNISGNVSSFSYHNGYWNQNTQQISKKISPQIPEDMISPEDLFEQHHYFISDISYSKGGIVGDLAMEVQNYFLYVYNGSSVKIYIFNGKTGDFK